MDRQDVASVSCEDITVGDKRDAGKHDRAKLPKHPVPGKGRTGEFVGHTVLLAVPQSKQNQLSEHPAIHPRTHHKQTWHTWPGMAQSS